MEMFNLPYIGVLTLEHTFYHYDEPVLFTGKDKNGRRYLCSCCKLSERWVVTTVTVPALLAFIDNRITIREMFEWTEEFRFTIDRGKARDSVTLDIVPELLPKMGAKLELPTEGTTEYHLGLLKECPKTTIAD